MRTPCATWKPIGTSSSSVFNPSSDSLKSDNSRPNPSPGSAARRPESLFHPTADPAEQTACAQSKQRPGRRLGHQCQLPTNFSTWEGGIVDIHIEKPALQLAHLRGRNRKALLWNRA